MLDLDMFELKNYAHDLRVRTFEAFVALEEAHLGGSFSMIELLVFIKKALMQNEDELILSKSHASIPFCLMMRDEGFDTPLTTHLERDPSNGVICTTGSLGHGLPIACGIALGKLLAGNTTDRVFVIISDGECQEGTTWESALIASARSLSNLMVFVDFNKIQALQWVDEVLPLGDLGAKFSAFGWNVVEIEDGNCFDSFRSDWRDCVNDKPTIVICNTVKGKGISQFENDPVWHAKKIRGIDIEIGREALKTK